MNWSEITSALAVLGPVFGITYLVLGFVIWVLKSHIQSKNEQIAQLRLDKQTLAADMVGSQADARTARVERDAAQHELVQLRSDVKRHAESLDASRKRYDHAAEVCRSNYEFWQRERARRVVQESRANQLNADLVNSQAAQSAAEVTAAEAGTALEKFQLRASRSSKKVRELQRQINGVIKQDGRVWKKSIAKDVPPFVPLRERKTRIISVFNLKGGVGKTTITANLAGSLSRANRRVMVVDVDHQRSLSQMLLTQADRESAEASCRTIQDFLTSPMHDTNSLMSAAMEIRNLTNTRILTNVDPRKGHRIEKSLDDLEMQLLGDWLVNSKSPDVRFLMRKALHTEVVGSELDYVLFDCPPRLTTACINALTASDFVLIPVQPESVSLRSVQHLLNRLKELQDAGVLAHIQVLGLVSNLVTPKSAAAIAHESRLLETAALAARSVWGKPITAFDTTLSRSHYYAAASQQLASGKSLKLAVDYPSIRDQYESLLSEIEERIDESLGVAGVHS